MNRHALILTLVTFFAIGANAQLDGSLISNGQGKIDIIHLNVGQGDATLILGPLSGGKRSAILFDSGEIPTRSKDGGKVVLDALISINISEIDYYISSHHHSDHYGGMLYDSPTTSKYGTSFVLGMNGVPGDDGDDDGNGIINWYEGRSIDFQELGGGDDINVLNFVDRGPKKPGSRPTGYYKRYLDIAGNMGNHVEVVDLSDVNSTEINLGGGVIMECVASNGYVKGRDSKVDKVTSENERSLAFVLHFRNFHYYIGGDLNGRKYASEDAYIEREVGGYLKSKNITLDVIQVNHHGANNCSETKFLELTKPKAAIISCGNNNDHGHPHKETLERLIEAGVEIYQTEAGKPKDILSTAITSKQNIADGHIYLTSGGTGFKIRY